jgi:hypothetical protein
MKKNTKHLVLALLFCGVSYAAEKPTIDCSISATSIQSEIKTQPSAVLMIVEKAMKLHPNCSCEIVKAAIRASDADAELVASIVEVAVIASPEHTRLIAQCAVAVAPDALDAVQEILAKLDPGTGESGLSGKEVAEKGGLDPKSATTDSAGHPLDFPTNGQQVAVGPIAGLSPSTAYVPWIFPYQPPFVDPTPATNNDTPD